MKKLLFFLLPLLLLTACSHDDDEWETMEWEYSTTLVKDSNGDEYIPVTRDGGDYTLTCKNYSSCWLVNIDERNGNKHVNYYPSYTDTLDDVHNISSPWMTARAESNYLKVHIDANNSGKERTATVGVTAGDIFDEIQFRQGK